MSEPRNVTPGVATDPGIRSEGAGGAGRGTQVGADGGGPEWFSWGAGGGGGRRVPWLGILLLLIGGVLLLEQLFPGLRFRTMLIVALGVVFAAGFVITRSRWLVTPTFLALGLGVGLLVTDLGIVAGSAWPLTLGFAMLALWVVGQLTRRPRGWAFWLGGLLAIVGLAELSQQIPGLPDLGNYWPALLILAGAVVLLRGRPNQRPDAL